MQRLGKFLSLSGSDRRLLVEAAIWLGVARLIVLLVPFRWITPFLGMHMAESPDTQKQVQKQFAVRVSWAIWTASRHMPWKCKCLVQAMAGKCILKRRRIPSTLYLGLLKDENEKLKAHAWLRSGDTIAIGGREIDQYKVISTFAEGKH